MQDKNRLASLFAFSDVIVHIGAGAASEVSSYTGSGSSKKILLVEADIEKANLLRMRWSSNPDVTILCAAISEKGGKRRFYRYNYSGVDGIREGHGVRSLYPGLHLDRVEDVDSLTLREAIEISGISLTHDSFLVLDAPGEELGILRSMRNSGLIEKFQKMIVRASWKQLYVNGPSAKEIVAFLETQGLSVNWFDDDRDSEFPEIYLESHDARKLQEKVEELRSEVQQSKKQLEEYVALTSYIETGTLMPGLHGWPVSPDFAMELVRQLHFGEYDFVIEFGSGASTVLMAEVIRNKKGRVKAPRNVPTAEVQADEVKRKGEKAPASDSPAGKSRDEVGFLSFDHLEKYFDETKDMLEQRKLLEYVDLKCAPITKFYDEKYGGFHFYDCSASINELAESRDKTEQGRGLIVVDGPPGSTGPHARFPALPSVLQHFGEIGFDIIVDDYYRAEDNEVVTMWQAILEAKQIDYEKIVLDFEKGACILRVNPARAE